MNELISNSIDLLKDLIEIESYSFNEDKTGNKIKSEHIDALNLVHGNLYNEISDKISSFGRNLAKNPLMISGYGAEELRIILSLTEDVVPSIYNELAAFQVKYDNANKNEKKVILEEFTFYAQALNIFIPGSYVKKEEKVTGLTVELKKGNLKNTLINNYLDK